MAALIRGRPHLALLLAWVALASAVSAHRLDEYLQATLVVIEPDGIRLQMNLVPGVAVAGQVLERIDRDHDGAIASTEAAAYAEALRRDLVVRLDQRTLELRVAVARFPVPAELRTGSGTVQVEFSAAPARLAPGTHRLALENRHLPSVSVYQINAARSGSDVVRIAAQRRNHDQSSGEIEFHIGPAAGERGCASVASVGGR